MTHAEAHRLYPAYADGLLRESDRSALLRHLEECNRCRRAFDILDRTLAPGSKHAERLSLDPYLPARIRAIASDPRPTGLHVLAPALRWSLALTLALALGIYLGQGLSRSIQDPVTDDPVSEFAVSLSGTDLADRLSSAVGENEGGQP
jgi:anti-sigma factor RsiW